MYRFTCMARPGTLTEPAHSRLAGGVDSAGKTMYMAVRQGWGGGLGDLMYNACMTDWPPQFSLVTE